MCLECGAIGFLPSITGKGCAFCDGTDSGNPPIIEPKSAMADHRFIRPTLASTVPEKVQADLVRVIEEAGELIQACTKTLRFGLNNYDPRDENRERNIAAVLREYDDLDNAMLRLHQDLGG